MQQHWTLGSTLEKAMHSTGQSVQTHGSVAQTVARYSRLTSWTTRELHGEFSVLSYSFEFFRDSRPTDNFFVFEALQTELQCRIFRGMNELSLR